MNRKLARIVTVDALLPLPGADRIEVARVGGWKAVVKKGEFRTGDKAVYFEIDAFLPSGNPAWQFLVDKSSRDHEGQTGHVLRSVRLQKQLSQGLVLPLNSFGHIDLSALAVGTEVTEALGVSKYDKPLPKELWEVANGYFPAQVPRTDQERIQNLSAELDAWKSCPVGKELTWEVSEKLEGESTSFIQLEGKLHVCSREVDYKDLPQIHLWRMAHKLQIRDKLKEMFGDRPLALQGEMVGPGIEGNIYGLNEQTFFLYGVYDVQDGCYWLPARRRVLALDLGLNHVPVVDRRFTLQRDTNVDDLLAMADGRSVLNPKQRREGLVFQCDQEDVSFKAVSNAYLLKEKLPSLATAALAVA